MQLVGVTALVTIMSHLLFIAMAFWCIQRVHLERHWAVPALPGKLLIVMLSVGLGFLCSSCFLSILNNVHDLSFLIR